MERNFKCSTLHDDTWISKQPLCMAKSYALLSAAARAGCRHCDVLQIAASSHSHCKAAPLGRLSSQASSGPSLKAT